MLEYDEIMSIGPWDIIITKIRNNDENKTLLLYKVFQSMDEFMTGNFTYHLQTPKNKHYNASIISSFKKETRPKAWKGIDLKVQSILPLVGIVPIDDNVNGGDGKEVDDCIVKVTYQLNRKE